MTRQTRDQLLLPTVPGLAAPDGFHGRVTALGLTLGDSQIVLLGDYLARLLAMNQRMNLTAIVDPSEAWIRHVEDALYLGPMLSDLAKGARIADVGSGGGLPAIPLAIAFPDLLFSLIESTQKKAAFLRDLAAALGLRNVSVLPVRAELVALGRMRGSFEVITARAVAKLSLLVPLTAPLLRDGGRMLFIKGQRVDEELALAAAAILDAHMIHRDTIATPTGRVVVLERAIRAR